MPRLSSRAALLALPFLVAAVGCKGNSLDGKWKMSGATQPGMSDVIWNFHGGALDMDMTMSQPLIGTIKVKGTGTYKVEGDTLSMNVTDVNVDSSGATPLAKSKLDSPDAKAMMKSQLNQVQTAKVKFDSSDQVLLTSNGKTQTLTRVK